MTHNAQLIGPQVEPVQRRLVEVQDAADAQRGASGPSNRPPQRHTMSRSWLPAGALTPRLEFEGRARLGR